MADRALQCLEIGTYEGRSATWIAQNLLNNPDSHLICIDPNQSDNIFSRWKRNLEVTGRATQVSLVPDLSQVVLPQLDQNAFDFIYIDGDHHGSAVIVDACNSWRLLKTDGILIFDDYEWTAPGYAPHELPGPAIDYFLSLYHQELIILEMDYQVIVRKIAKSVD